DELGLVDGLPVDGQIGGQAYAPVRPRRLRVPLLSEDEPGGDGRVVGLERKPWTAPDLLRQRATEDVGDVSVATLEHGQAGGFVGDAPPDQRLDVRGFAPVLLVRLQDQLYARLERDELVRSRSHGRFLEAVIADLLHVPLGNDPCGAGGGRTV